MTRNLWTKIEVTDNKSENIINIKKMLIRLMDSVKNNQTSFSIAKQTVPVYQYVVYY